MNNKIKSELFLIKFKPFERKWFIKSDFISNKVKIDFECIACSKITSKLPKIFLLNFKCKFCHYKSKISNTACFIEKSKKANLGNFDYSKVEYIGNQSKVIIICLNHNIEFSQEPRHHLEGHGCNQCHKEKIRLANSKTQENFINKSEQIHKGTYKYDQVIYLNNNTLVKIFCIKCNKYFEQLPRFHISGHGCDDCAINTRSIKKTKSVSQFLKCITNTKYSYDFTNFNGFTKNKIKIFCKKCQKYFNQTPIAHLSGQGCPFCCKGSISKVELKWLDILNIPEKFRQQHLIISGKKYIVDAYNPIKNTVYEFYGDFWHGNPDYFNLYDINCLNKKTFGNLYQNTLDRQKIIINAGYILICIWENEFHKQYDKY